TVQRKSTNTCLRDVICRARSPSFFGHARPPHTHTHTHALCCVAVFVLHGGVAVLRRERRRPVPFASRDSLRGHDSGISRTRLAAKVEEKTECEDVCLP